MSLQFSSLWPAWLILAMTAALAGAVIFGAIVLVRKNVRPGLIAMLTALRLGIVVVFVLVMLQPVISYTRMQEQKPGLLVLIDTSASMGKSGAAGKGDRLHEVLAELQKGEFATALRRQHGLSWFTFAADAKPIDEAELTTLTASGTTTQLADSLNSVRNHWRALGKKAQRVLLVSDGNDLGQGDPVEVARRLGLTIDVLAPTPGHDADPGRFEIADVQSARRVLLGSETHFRLTLRGNQPAVKDASFTLRVTEDGTKVLQQKLVVKAGQSEQVYSLAHRPPTIGLKQYAFHLEHKDEKKDQADSPFRLNVLVVDSKYEVLILEDTWRWEYKYLHRLFEDDPSFRFSALLSRGKGNFVQFGSPDRRVNLIGFPQNRADLEGFDTFVVGDVNPTRWPRGLAGALAEQVMEEGKTLVVIAGPNLANFLDVPELYALLPVELTRESGNPVEGPIQVRSRPEASSSPFFFQLGAGEAEKLPPLDQIYPVQRKRAGATVLMEAAKNRNGYGNLIVLAEHTVDRGRVLFVGTDTLWKWHTLSAASEGPSPYSIFWQQAFRAMTPARSQLGPVNLWLTPQTSRGEVGRSMVVHAEVQSNRPLPHLQVQGAVTLPDSKRHTLAFSPDPAQPTRFRAEFAPSVPGQHKITATALAESKPVADGATAIEVDDARSEMADRGVDLVNLARIARDTGGKLLDPSRPETWPSGEDQPLASVSQMRTFDLWNSFTLLLVLCGLLGIDWFVRLFKGLV